MSQAAAAKVTLAVAGVVVFLIGIRSGQELLRWLGIGLVAVAWLLRFVGRRNQLHSQSTDTSLEDR